MSFTKITITSASSGPALFSQCELSFRFLLDSLEKEVSYLAGTLRSLVAKPTAAEDDRGSEISQGRSGRAAGVDIG